MAVGIAYGVYPWHSSAYDSQERMALKREGSKDIQGVPRPDSELKHELLCTNSNMYMRCEWWHLRLWRPPNDPNGHAWPHVDLNNLCYHAFMASKYFLEMVKMEGRKRIVIHRLAWRSAPIFQILWLSPVLWTVSPSPVQSNIFKSFESNPSPTSSQTSSFPGVICDWTSHITRLDKHCHRCATIPFSQKKVQKVRIYHSN